MDDNIYLLLIDTGNNFIMVKGKQKVAIDYGLYAMMIGSIDFHAVEELFHDQTFLRTVAAIAELGHTFGDVQRWYEIEHCNPWISRSLLSLYEPLKKILDTGHLQGRQLSLVVELFLHEIRLHALHHHNPNNIAAFMPRFLYMDRLKEHIKGLLLRDTKKISKALQDEMNALKLEATINMAGKDPCFVYHVKDTVDILLVDLLKYLTAKKTAKECKYCGRMFYPIKRRNARYCRLPHKDTDKTCDYIMHHTPKDELEKIYNTAKRQQAKKRDYEPNINAYGWEFMDGIFQEWKEECDRQYAIARQSNHKDAFIQWIEETKFKKKRLGELYKEYNNMDK